MNHLKLFEEVGVNKEVVNLSNYVIDKIFKENKIPKDYVFNRDQIEEITSLPINKLVVTYSPINKGEKLPSVAGRDKVRGYFNITNSKRFKSGNVELYVTLTDLRKTLVYHEINHALQFIKIGKSKSIENYSLNTYANMISKNFKNKEIISFAELVYYCAETEINSKVVEFYAQIRGLMKQELKKIKIPKDFDKKLLEERLEDFKKKYFIESIKSKDAIVMAKYCSKMNIQKHFQNCDEYDKKLYFGLLNNIIELKKIGNVIMPENLPKYGFLLKVLGQKIPDLKFKPPLLEEKKLNSDMKFYQSYINRQGEKLKRKLIKTWFVIEKEITIDDILKYQNF